MKDVGRRTFWCNLECDGGKKNTVDTTLDRVFVVVGREFDMCLACCLIISLLPQHNVVKAT